jgi:hypothetical protein
MPAPSSLNIYLNIILPSLSRSPKWFLLFRFSDYKSSSYFSHACYISRLSHPSSYDCSNNISSRLRIIKLVNLKFSQRSSYFLPLMSKYSPQQSVREAPVCFSVRVRDQVSHPHKTIGTTSRKGMLVEKLIVAQLPC